MIGQRVGHLPKIITKEFRLILPGVICTSARSDFWLLRDELEFRKRGKGITERDTQHVQRFGGTRKHGLFMNGSSWWQMMERRV